MCFLPPRPIITSIHCASQLPRFIVGKVDLNEDTVEAMLATASMLQLNEVTKACCEFLKKQLHPSNCIGFGLFADRQCCQDLKKAASDYTAVFRMLLYRRSRDTFEKFYYFSINL